LHPKTRELWAPPTSERQVDAGSDRLLDGSSGTMRKGSTHDILSLLNPAREQDVTSRRFAARQHRRQSLPPRTNTPLRRRPPTRYFSDRARGGRCTTSDSLAPTLDSAPVFDIPRFSRPAVASARDCGIRCHRPLGAITLIKAEKVAASIAGERSLSWPGHFRGQ